MRGGRRARFAAGGLVMVIALAGGVSTSCQDGGSGNSASRADPPETAVAPTTTERPSAEEMIEAIRVEETGFTPGQVVACNTPGGQATDFYPAAENCPPEQRAPIGDAIAYGIVIRNTSDQVVTNIPIRLRFLDSAGEVVPEPLTVFSDADPTSTDGSIELLRPGETFGFGDMTYIDRPGVASIEVEIEEPGDWMSPAYSDVVHLDSAVAAAEVTASDISVSYGPQNEPVVTFAAESNIDQPIRAPVAYAIFRDAAGKVVGGYGADMERDIPPAGEVVNGEVHIDDPLEIPGIDPSRTEIFFSAFHV